MSNFTIKQSFFIPSYGFDEKEVKLIDKYLNVLDKSEIASLISVSQKEAEKGGRPPINPYNLLATVLYCFAFSKGSLRDIEERCKYDLRMIYLMDGMRATYKTFGNFINDVILPNRWELFKRITKTIFDECNIKMTVGFIDGSKFEADANKYKFVWKPTKYHESLGNKIRELLERNNLSRGINRTGIIKSNDVAKKLVELNELMQSISEDRIHCKKLEKDYKLLSEYLIKSLEYEEKERICGPDRNSYYKTDHDATAMTLKEDYYSGLGSNMHAAYCTQIMTINGMISTFLVTQSRHDSKDFIEIMDKHYELYESYPEKVCADAGYGTLENYSYINSHQIKNFIKHYTWEGNVSGRNPSQYHLNDDATITCLNGKTGKLDSSITWHRRYSNSLFYKVEGCSNCDFCVYCKRYMKIKDEDYKIFEVRPAFQIYIQQAEENLLSTEGIEMRVNRSAQVEGAYGVIKQDMQFERFRRTTLEKVELEFMLIILGYNIRKLFKHFLGKGKNTYWTAPENLQPETIKKPSAKRLANKVNKKKNKSKNEIAKDSYKYK